MGARGPASKAPGGYGILTREGYRRIWHGGRYRMEHDVVWEVANGPIPDGYEVHHRDENPINNDLGNLQLLTRLEHKRLHSGCMLRDDGWWKPCCRCGEVLRIEHFTRPSREWPDSYCRPCRSAMTAAYKRERRYAQGRRSSAPVIG